MKIKSLGISMIAVVASLVMHTANATTVAIVTGGFYTENLKNQLIANGVTVSEISSYTAASLTPFDAVIQYGNDFIDQDALVSYVSAGGRLIESPWFWNNNSPVAALDIFSHGGGLQYHGSFPGVTVLASNPLLNGVVFPGAGATDLGRTVGNAFTAGVTQIANWSDGTAFIGEKSLGLGQVIGINMHVITSDTAYQIIDQPWATQLYLNALSETPVNDVPEPASLALLGAGMMAMAMRKRKAA